MKKSMVGKFLFGLFFIFSFLISGCRSGDFNTVKNGTPIRIGISWSKNITGEIPIYTQDYLTSVEKVGAVPVLLEQVKNQEDARRILQTVDAVILTGGEDVTPSYYNEKPHPNLEQTNPVRDVSDYWLIKVALQKDYPLLGTCRGAQMLNTVLGGTLYQDIPSEVVSDVAHRDPQGKGFAYHPCKIVDRDSHLYRAYRTENLRINSWHHQAIEKPGKGLKVTAVAPDGVVEAVELEGATFVVGVQFHPEALIAEDKKDEYLPIFEALRDAAREKRK